LRVRSKKNGPVPRDRPVACLERLVALLPPPPATAPPTATTASTTVTPSGFRGRGCRHIHRGGQGRYPNGGSNGRADRAEAPEQGNRRCCYGLGEPPAWPLSGVGAGRQKAISHSVQPSFPLPCRSMRDLVVTAKRAFLASVRDKQPSRQSEPARRHESRRIKKQHSRARWSCQAPNRAQRRRCHASPRLRSVPVPTRTIVATSDPHFMIG
jgi:hypothetical protein